MKSSTTTIDAISRSAARLRLGLLVTLVMMVALYGIARFGFHLGGVRIDYHLKDPDLPSTRFIGDVALALLVIALFRLSQMLDQLASGELFSAGVIARFRSFAFWLLVMALFELAAPTAAQLFGLSRAGNHRVEIAVDFREILTVGVTLVLFLLARLLERARGLDEENREFV